MTTMAFLGALPAILGFAGFVIFALLRRRASADPVLTEIVAKLRSAAPDVVTDDRLRAAQVERLLNKHNELRRSITDQDYNLLDRIVRQQFASAVVVYLLCGLLCLAGIILFVYQFRLQQIESRVLKIEDLRLRSTADEAGGLLVDTDPIEARWAARGDEGDMQLFLENLDSGARTAPVTVASGTHTFVWPRERYSAVVQKRTRGEVNRIRVVSQTSANVFKSTEVPMHVGVTILLFVRAPDRVDLAAMIDNSRIVGYSFEALVSAPARRVDQPSLRVGPQIQYGRPLPRVANLNAYDWKAAKIIYFGPDDRRIVRTDRVIDETVTAVTEKGVVPVAARPTLEAFQSRTAAPIYAEAGAARLWFRAEAPRSALERRRHVGLGRAA